jgi:hypothetical protein
MTASTEPPLSVWLRERGGGRGWGGGGREGQRPKEQYLHGAWKRWAENYAAWGWALEFLLHLLGIEPQHNSVKSVCARARGSQKETPREHALQNLVMRHRKSRLRAVGVSVCWYLSRGGRGGGRTSHERFTYMRAEPLTYMNDHVRERFCRILELRDKVHQYMHVCSCAC